MTNHLTRRLPENRTQDSLQAANAAYEVLAKEHAALREERDDWKAKYLDAKAHIDELLERL